MRAIAISHSHFTLETRYIAPLHYFTQDVALLSLTLQPLVFPLL
ncbi:MAG TPA: hypothetical protein V6D09_11930 [Leptolyngbyaceae cyanobacterium]